MFLAFGLALHAFEYKFSAIDLTQELKYLNKCLKEAADIVEYNIYIDRSSRFIINDEGKIQFINNCSDGSKYCILSYFVLDEYGNTRKITTHEVR